MGRLGPFWSRFVCFTEYFVHRFPLGKFVDELVEVTDFAHRRLFDFLDANAANDAADQRPVGMEAGCLEEEGLVVDLIAERRIDPFGGVAG